MSGRPADLQRGYHSDTVGQAIHGRRREAQSTERPHAGAI